MSQPTIPVLGRDYAKVGVPVMWNNKMLVIQDLLNAVPSEGDDPVDSYRWLDSICKYAWGMHVAVPELPEALEVSMAATDLAIAKLRSLHREHKPQRMAPRIFMVPPGAWVPSNMEGYGNRPKWARRQMERVAVSGDKGKQKMTQDNDSDDSADDHEDDMQGGGDDSNDRVPEDLDGPCQECSREGRATSCEGEPQQHKNPIAPQAAASSSNKHAKPMPPAASSSSSLPPIKVTLQLPCEVIDRALCRGPTPEFLTSPSTAPAPSPTVPSPELPVASQP
ncbi:hypothetical protein EDC04DRAFT_2606468 [Pisolithus marmoratus]|nr:hypothetical protein EDC04DRAFT_2606468 [Pisolithus marmoratus]